MFPPQDARLGLVGTWRALSGQQAWTALEISPDSKIRILIGQSQLNGTADFSTDGGLALQIYADSRTVPLDGYWILHTNELRLEFKSIDMMFARIK